MPPLPGPPKPIARMQSAGGGIRSHRRSQLLEQRRIASPVDAQQYSAIQSSAIVRIWQMPSHGSHKSDVVQGMIIGAALAYLTAILMMNAVARAITTTVNGWSTILKCGQPGNGILVRAACAKALPAVKCV